MGYFQLPPWLYNFLPALAAGALAFLTFLLSRRGLERLERPKAGRLAAFVSEAVTPQTAPVGSLPHRVRLAFARYGLRIAGREGFYLNLARLVVGGTLTLLFYAIAGFPFFTSLVGLVAGYVLVNGQVTRAWNRMRTDMEAEIPALLSGMKSAIAVAPNVPQALADAAQTLRNGGPLRAWAEAAAARMHAEGVPCLESLKQDAAAISPSLAVCVAMIGRMWTTGGSGYAQAFESAAENLRETLSARVLARARGSGAQSTTNLLMGLAIAMIIFLNHNPAMASTVRLPMVQIAYAVILVMIVYGYNMINDTIENAV